MSMIFQSIWDKPCLHSGSVSIVRFVDISLELRFIPLLIATKCSVTIRSEAYL